MSSNKRPWYKWYPKDFNQDEKVKSLSPKAEIVYRRLLDVMWQANDCQLPSNCLKLANMVAWDLLDFASEKLEENFKKIWDEIQYPGFELFKTTEDGLWIYSKRLTSQLNEIKDKEKSFELLRKIRAESGRKGGKAKRKQMLSKKKANAKQMLSKRLQDTDTDTDTELKDYPKGKDGKKAVPPKDLISLGSIPKIKAETQKVGKELYDNNIFPKVFAFINKMLKEQKSERAILHSLTRCYAKAMNKDGFKKDGGPWAYCTRIMQVENGNYNEAEYQKTTKKSD